MCLLVGWLVVVVLVMNRCVFMCLLRLMCSMLGWYLCWCSYCCVCLCLMMVGVFLVCVIVVVSIFSIYWLEFW